MKTYVTVNFENGAQIRSVINATPQQAMEYYYGKMFNLGDGKGGDNMQRCTSVFTSPEPYYN